MKAEYDEIVIFNETHILPFALVMIHKTHTELSFRVSLHQVPLVASSFPEVYLTLHNLGGEQVIASQLFAERAANEKMKKEWEAEKQYLENELVKLKLEKLECEIAKEDMIAEWKNEKQQLETEIQLLKGNGNGQSDGHFVLGAIELLKKKAMEFKKTPSTTELSPSGTLSKISFFSLTTAICSAFQ